MEDKIIQKDGYTIRVVPPIKKSTQESIDKFYQLMAELYIRNQTYA